MAVQSLILKLVRGGGHMVVLYTVLWFTGFYCAGMLYYRSRVITISAEHGEDHGNTDAAAGGNLGVGDQDIFALNVSDKYVPVLQGTPPSTSDKMTILFWSAKNADQFNEQMTTYCEPHGMKSCQFTEDHELYNKSEAVLINLIHIGIGLEITDVPTYRFAFQKWVFYEVEPPPVVWNLRYWKTPLRYLPYRNLFNVTCLPTTSADILMQHLYLPAEVDQAKRDELRSINYAQNKTKRVAWFVSHCTSQSRREAYVDELRKYIDVDIYGKCGNLSCGAPGNYAVDCDDGILSHDYKFYLSFENSLCEEYVTEKLYRLIRRPLATIPVVLGGVNYKSILPEKTYIDVKDFSSPQALARFLHMIDQDDDLFNNYIQRKNALKWTKFPPESKVPVACRMCDFLHWRRDNVMIAPDVTRFYGVKERCLQPEHYYKGVPGISDHTLIG